LAEEKKRGSGAVENILLSNHPVFQQLQRECGISFRVFFTNVEELSALLVDRGYREVPEIEWQSPEYMEWIRSTANEQPILKIKRAIFDSDHRLVVFSPYEWKQEFLQVEKRNQPARTH
jgi:hypothetical protein